MIKHVSYNSGIIPSIVVFLTFLVTAVLTIKFAHRITLLAAILNLFAFIDEAAGQDNAGQLYPRPLARVQRFSSRQYQ